MSQAVDLPHLRSPAHLAVADREGRYAVPKHLGVLNSELMEVAWRDTRRLGGARLRVHMPFGHGKTLLASNYFPAWMLMHFPNTRIGLVGYNESFAAIQGGKVRDIVEKWGKDLGVRLRSDSQAKDEWSIEGKEGGMVCRGPTGGMTGRPIDCLPGETRISTEIGLVKIEDLCTMPVKPRVLSYNHQSRRLEWRTIMAFRRSQADELLEFATSGGENTLRCTGNHRLGAVDGYRKADLVRAGDQLFSHSLSGLWAEDGQAWKGLQRLLGENTQDRNKNRLRELWERVLEEEVRNNKIGKKENVALLLAGLHDCSASFEVQEVREANGEEHKPVLRHLSSKLLRKNEKAERSAMLVVPGDVQAGLVKNAVLRQEMCKFDARGKNARIGKLAFQDGHELRETVHVNEAADSGPGRASVRDVRGDRGVSGEKVEGASCKILDDVHSPHRRDCEEQRTWEPCVNLSQVSSEDSQDEVQSVAVQMVQRIRTNSVAVYDIQVEGNSNFFAEGILVHNCFLIDDLIKDAEQAMSTTIMENHDEWYKTTVEGRAKNHTSVIFTTTRWSKNDLPGRIEARARKTGEQWKVVKFRAIAGENDPLGRKPGEALWPSEVSAEQLLRKKETVGRWWSACWQQEPEDEEGAYFTPRKWPHYLDLGDAYSIPGAYGRREVILKCDTIVLCSVDWAWSVKSTADHTAIPTAALLPDGRLLLLDVFNRRVRLEELAPALAGICRAWRPAMVGVEVGHPTLHNEYRRYPEIPEVRWLPTKSKNKLTRALPAIMMGENGRILLPESAPWREDYCSQLTSFTGIDDEEDDMVDGTSWLAVMAQSLRGARRSTEEWPCVLVAGKEW